MAHVEVEHDHGPSWCAECRTVWPCARAEEQPS